MKKVIILRKISDAENFRSTILQPFQFEPSGMRTRRAFKVKEEAFLCIFKGLSFAENGLRPEVAPLSNLHIEVQKNIPSFLRYVQFLSSAMGNIPQPLSDLRADFNGRNWFTFGLLKRSKTELGSGIYILSFAICDKTGYFL